MPYTTLTLTQALTELGRRLNDPDSVFWTDAEKTQYIYEALRAFNAHANFHRATFSFDTVVDQTWYDISDSSAIPSTLRGQSVTDQDIYTLIEYHFLEPPTAAVWTGTNQFTIDDLIGAVQRRRDQLLYETGHQITRTIVNAVGYETTLADTFIDVRRIAWLPNPDETDYSNSPLWRDDQWSINSYKRNQVPTFAVPTTYRLSTQPPLTFSTDYKPPVTGNYEVLSIESGVVLSAGAATVLAVPDDFAWVIKYGAMADLLGRESVARDPMRAQYCELRYRQGLALLRASAAVLNAEIDYTTLDVDAVQNGDNYRVGWQGEPSGVPTNVYTAGLNLLALANTPDDTYEVDLTVVRNAPLPATGSDYLQVGREDYDAILDLAQHLAAFKHGGWEFAQTLPLLTNFLRHCKTYNSKLNQMGEFTDIIYDQSRTQGYFFPILQPAELATEGE